MEMGFQFEQHRLGLWDLSWDLKKTISWEMGLGSPLPYTTLHQQCVIPDNAHCPLRRRLSYFQSQ